MTIVINMNKKPKTQKKYKQLLIAHYGFTNIDFYNDGDKIYCCSQDNVDVNVRDVYDTLSSEHFAEKENKEEEMDETTRQKALDWFFSKTESEKKQLKVEHFPTTHIRYDSHWGYAFTFGQIEEMYLNLGYEE